MDTTQNPMLANLPTVHRAPSERTFFTKLRRFLGSVPFAEDLIAGYYCAIDRNTPAYVRGVLLGAIAYFVLPTDMIPDFLAGLGFTDDASVLAATLAAVGGHIQPHHRSQARSRLDRLIR
jgi:uncharacterized membrane protein YkvA (DUF1232 family)